MTESGHRGVWANRQGLKLGLAAVMLITAGVLGLRHFVGTDEHVSAELIAAVGDQTWEIQCSACGKTYTLSAAEFLAVCEDRSETGIICKHCGKKAAWRAKRPMEYTGEQWNSGWVGRDVLIEDLKAYHAAHPEGEAVAEVPEDD